MIDPEHILSMDVSASVEIDADPERAFGLLTGRIGDWLLDYPTGDGLGMALEPFAGGRLYRDLPGGAGAWWANVQVIRPPRLLELWGPMFATAPSVSHIRFDLESAPGARTRVSVRHRTIGDTPAHADLVGTVWAWHLERLASVSGSDR